MRVQLRIQRPAGPMLEPGDHQALGVDDHHPVATSTRERGVVLEIPETRVLDRHHMGGAHLGTHAEIVRTIVSLAENMGMEVVAEGVETLSQLTQLRKLNCKYGQGYLFSRPVDPESVTAWIARKPHWQEDLFPAMNEHYVPSIKTAPVMQLARA